MKDRLERSSPTAPDIDSWAGLLDAPLAWFTSQQLSNSLVFWRARFVRR